MAVISNLTSTGGSAPPDFDNLTDWDAWVTTEYPGNPTNYILECHDDFGPDGYLEPNGSYVGVWGQNSANRGTIRAAAGDEADGVPFKGFYIRGTGNSDLTLRVGNYFNVENIGVYIDRAGSWGGGIYSAGKTSETTEPGMNRVTNCVSINSRTGDNTYPAFRGLGTVFENCLAVDAGVGFSADSNRYIILRNCHAVGVGIDYGYRGAAQQNVKMQNCSAIGFLSDFEAGVRNLASNNASGDTSAVDNGLGTITGLVSNPGVDWVDPAGGDYHTTSTGKLPYGSGFDLTGLLDFDAARELRSVPPGYNIGPLNQAGGAPPIGIQEMYIKDGGIFVKYTPHVKVGGTFQEVDAYVLESGVWVQVYEK